MNIQKTDFDRTLHDFLGDANFAHVSFVDGDDRYSIKMQRQGGVLAGCIDCIPKLNGQNAWQVHRSQPLSTTVGDLLLKIASAPSGTVASKFFD